MKDRRLLPNGEIEEWERPRTIPDDFVYDPETHSYYPPGEPTDFDFEAWGREFDQRLEEIRKLPRRTGPRVTIPASALAVPPSWRKSLGVERGLLFDLLDDEAATAEEPTARDAPEGE